MGVCVVGGWLIVPADNVRYKSHETLDKIYVRKVKAAALVKSVGL